MFAKHVGQDPVNMSLVAELEGRDLFGDYGIRYSILFYALQEDDNGDRLVLCSWIFGSEGERDMVYNNILEKFFIEV